MKIKYENDLLIIYLYNKKLNLEDNDSLIKEIKNVLKCIVKNYRIELRGIYEVIIYQNIYYGYVLEINKIKDFEYSDFIDVKLKIKENTDFYLEFQDYFLISNIDEVYYNNNYFYVNINKFSNINKIIEFSKIIYKNDSIRLKKLSTFKDKV